MKTFFDFKYFKILQTFSEEELKAFDLWLRSPWCNTNKNLIKLLEKVKRFHPTYEDKKLSKEKLFKQILPKGKFSDRRMNNLLSEGYLAAERFMIFQNLAKDENLKKDLLTKEFQNRHLEDWFFRDVNKEIARLEDKKIKDWEDHLDLLKLNRRVYHHPNQNPRMQPGGQTIVKMGEQVDLIFLLEKAAIINEKIFRNRILKNENHEIEEELKKWIFASEGIEHPAIEFYKMRFDYTGEDALKKYFELREAFIIRFEELNNKEQKTHLISLFNDSFIFIKSRLLDITELLPLYKLGLKYEILLIQGKLNNRTYSVIVSASNTKKDFDFTYQFIKDFTKNLEVEYQQDTKTWALAHTAYWQKKYQRALDILLAHDFKVHFSQLSSRLLTTQVYFDLFLFDDSYQFYLFNYFDSFEKWLTRDKIHTQTSHKSYIRFVQLLRKLAKLYNDVNFSPEKISNLLDKESNIQASNWLEKRIEEVLQLKKRGHSK